MNTTENHRKVNHQPDASQTRLQNVPTNTMPFPDQIGNYQRNIGLPDGKFKDSKVYIVGSGIAGLSSAYYFIRDGQIPAGNITFLEKLQIEGGSLDGSGNAQTGYIICGVADIETIDKTWMLGTGSPIGPFGILDVVGLGTVYHIFKTEAERSGSEEKMKFVNVLKNQFIDAGKLGVSSGEGFYKYPYPTFQGKDFLK